MTKYRIVQIDHYGYTDYKVQRKRLISWKDVCLGNAFYDLLLDLRFNTYEEAYEWVMKKQKPKEKIVGYLQIEE